MFVKQHGKPLQWIDKSVLQPALDRQAAQAKAAAEVAKKEGK